jgi:hypothetical protein
MRGKIMSRIFSLTLVLALASGLSMAATIDNFNNSFANQTARDSVVDATAVTDVLGTRTIFADKSAGDEGIYLDSIISAQTEGYFTGSAGVTVAGTTGASYTGMWNLTAADTGFEIELIWNDLAGSTISFWLSDGTNTAVSPEYALPVIAQGQPSQMILALFSDFTGIGSVNMSAITSLGFVNTHTTNGDLALDNFGTQVIPEPGTYALMAAGLVGLYFARRRKA